MTATGSVFALACAPKMAPAAIRHMMARGTFPDPLPTFDA